MWVQKMEVDLLANHAGTYERIQDSQSTPDLVWGEEKT